MQNKALLFDAPLALLSEGAKALGHPARLEILRVLAARDTCVCGEIVGELPLAQATVSQHLKALKAAGLIKGEIDGPRVCYCLDRDAISALRDNLIAFFDSLAEKERETCC